MGRAQSWEGSSRSGNKGEVFNIARLFILSNTTGGLCLGELGAAGQAGTAGCLISSLWTDPSPSGLSCLCLRLQDFWEWSALRLDLAMGSPWPHLCGFTEAEWWVPEEGTAGVRELCLGCERDWEMPAERRGRSCSIGSRGSCTEVLQPSEN